LQSLLSIRSSLGLGRSPSISDLDSLTRDKTFRCNNFDQSYQSIEALLYEAPWDKHIDGPIPSEAIDCTPQHWYTQYWFDCAFAHQCANLTGLDFRDICDYEFTDDETIYTGHFLDLY